jgi:MFS family permease
MMRMLAINISASMMSVFLYQTGYAVWKIAAFWSIYYFLKIFMAIPVAKYAARFGPKHGILLSNLLYIPSMIFFSLVPDLGLGALIVTGLLQGLSATMYNVCYTIDFSKVKSLDHAGKEIAYMNMFEKLATGISPLIGGILAFMAGPEATMWAAAVLFACASIPLMKTAEPTKSGQKLVFRGFPWHLVWRSMVAETAVGFDVVTSGTVWLLLVSLAILGVHHGNVIYAQLGALVSVVLFAALAASYVYGVLIDRRRGGELLRVTVIMNALVHFTRPFITTPVAVAGINVANEAATTGYMMAFTRGMFDAADLTGHRFTYLACMELVANIGAALAAAIFMVLVLIFGDIQGMKYFFFIAGVVVLLVAVPKFPLYRK